MNDYIAAYNDPSDIAHAAAKNEAEGFATRARFVNGVGYWNSNDSVMPDDCAEFAAHVGYPVDIAAHRVAREKQCEEVFARYMEAQARRTPEERAEEDYERRAAFGPGVEVVNVFTGERTRT